MHFSEGRSPKLSWVAFLDPGSSHSGNTFLSPICRALGGPVLPSILDPIMKLLKKEGALFSEKIKINIISGTCYLVVIYEVDMARPCKLEN